MDYGIVVGNYPARVLPLFVTNWENNLESPQNWNIINPQSPSFHIWIYFETASGETIYGIKYLCF